jgi:predicted Zn-dependent protease
VSDRPVGSGAIPFCERVESGQDAMSHPFALSGAPRSLFAAAGDPSGLLTREESLARAQLVQSYMTSLDVTVGVYSALQGRTEFALNQVLRGADTSEQKLRFIEQFGRRFVTMGTDRVDDESLRTAVAKAEALAQALHNRGPAPEPRDPLRPPGPVNPALWSDSSLALLDPEGRLAAVDASLSAIRRAGLSGAGSTRGQPTTIGVLNKAGHYEFGRQSTCAFSLTVRTADDTGSGWTVWEGEDWSRCDVSAMTERAIDLAQRSKNPVAVEPGRYTVIMAPDAVGAVVGLIATAFNRHVLDGYVTDRGGYPFSKAGGGNKIGMQVFDERVSLSADPMDPDGGFLPFTFNSAHLLQYVPVTWVEHGILKTLSYSTRAEASQHGVDSVENSGGLRMAGGPTSIEEMIASTTRGIYVTRLSDVDAVAAKTLYLTGVTRDGTFLIEHGKITKPIKNMRFEDSPMFFLNNLEAIGPARRVERGNVMPPIKVRDFAFTSLTDSI